MKLKFIAAAAVLAASGVANAAIDTGTDGAGDLFFSIWDANSSYTLDLNIQQTDFSAAVAATGTYDFSTALTNDTVFQQFISTADTASLKWNVLAVESQAARTVFQTYSSELPASGITAGNARSMVLAAQTWIGTMNVAALNTADSAIFLNSDVSNYAGSRVRCNNFNFQSFSTCGTLANDSSANGLGFVVQTFGATGTAASVLTPVADNGDAVKVYLDSNYNLHMSAVAAVPEPETYAMLLAGLGLMGAAARRRNKKA